MPCAKHSHKTFSYVNSFKSQNHSRRQALRLLFPWPERTHVSLLFPGRARSPRSRRRGRESSKREEARDGGFQMPLSPPPGQHCLPDIDSMETVSSAWCHSLAPEGMPDARRKILFCQVTERTCRACNTEPGQNASFACALCGPLTPLTTPPFPAKMPGSLEPTKPLGLWAEKEGQA